MPQDGIAQAIRLRADVCIFQRLEEDGFFENISMADKTQLTKHASVFLREKPDSLTTFTDMLERHARDFQPQ